MSKREWTTIKEYEDIRFEFFEGIAKITIDRQEVYNAFRPQTNFEMLDAINICRERGSPPQRTRPAQSHPFSSETRHRHGKRIRHRWRPRASCRV